MSKDLEEALEEARAYSKETARTAREMKQQEVKLINKLEK